MTLGGSTSRGGTGELKGLKIQFSREELASADGFVEVSENSRKFLRDKFSARLRDETSLLTSCSGGRNRLTVTGARARARISTERYSSAQRHDTGKAGKTTMAFKVTLGIDELTEVDDILSSKTTRSCDLEKSLSYTHPSASTDTYNSNEPAQSFKSDYPQRSPDVIEEEQSKCSNSKEKSGNRRPSSKMLREIVLPVSLDIDTELGMYIQSVRQSITKVAAKMQMIDAIPFGQHSYWCNISCVL